VVLLTPDQVYQDGLSLEIIIDQAGFPHAVGTSGLFVAADREDTTDSDREDTTDSDRKDNTFTLELPPLRSSDATGECLCGPIDSVFMVQPIGGSVFVVQRGVSFSAAIVVQLSVFAVHLSVPMVQLSVPMSN